ncbi:tyrosine-protein phosphatase [Fusibacillus kribbianus]|uniref:protein-tyrosine-phosphatase n=1 Tax=Fusibacillus kribbianus TaxID=3044208 RepID=A0AAP4EZ71_9FIRM|nr:CpsB/CapC family capsule biosynthesis tyrosine phosphatase [Ruminococcus sp. YH-rum2234]MDI9241570.1 hypothetical protein [Ruminococcus sp. YH-rum2234]
MIDLHVHILPGVDDGVQDIKDSLCLVELALEGGVDTLVATPHSNQKGRFENYHTEELKQVFIDFYDALSEKGAQIQILPGMEIFASEDMGKKIREGLLIGLNYSRYFLVEFPFDGKPDWIFRRLSEIMDVGGIPLIAHPERYYCTQEAPELIYEWLQMGCLTQINKGSMFGKFGRRSERLSQIMLDNDLATCVASDAHGPYTRTTFMGDAADYLKDRYGDEQMYRLLVKNPEQIITDGIIPVHGKLPEKKRFFW